MRILPAVALSSLGLTILLMVEFVCPSRSCAATATHPVWGLDPLTTPVHALHTRIERETTKVSRTLSAEGRRIMNGSMYRYFAWAEGYCEGNTRCLRNQHVNYLTAIPHSVYRVGGWTVYNTGVYALEWADEDLQQMDPDRAFTWDFQLVWPRVDAKADRPNAGTVAAAADVALAARVHQLMADWMVAGWNRAIEVHLEGLDACYVSATITGSTYSGGAHPYEDFSTFNWNVRAKRALQNEDLFRTDTDWQAAVFALYRQRLQALGTNLSEWGLASDGMKSVLSDGFVMTANGLRFVQHQGATRAEVVPAIELGWPELAPWLVPGAICSMPPSSPPL